MIYLITHLLMLYTFLKHADAQICKPNPCLNTGACVPLDSEVFYCQCPSGYSGPYCEITPTSQCNCLNGGVCTATSNGQRCECTPEWSGANCEFVNPCYLNPCKNNGVCSTNLNNDPVCKCPPGYNGDFCQVNVNPNSCSSTVCKNGGTCFVEVSFLGSVTEFCKCPANFYGQFCETKITTELCNSDDSNYFFCPFWKMFGFCTFDYKYDYKPVPIVCPKSCSLCKELQSCQDLQPNCPLWFTLGLCQKVSDIDPSICRKSCQLCPANIFRKRK